jgi:hypothetical protein
VDALFPVVVGGVDRGQVAAEEGNQAEADRRLDEGEPDPSDTCGLGESQRERRRPAVGECLGEAAATEPPEHEGEGDRAQEHPDQRERNQRTGAKSDRISSRF